MIKEDETSFVWYPSWNKGYDVIKQNAPELALNLLEAIIKYGTTGKDTELDWQVMSFFCTVQGEIDRAKKRYEKAVEAGKKGGATTKYATKVKQMVLEGASTAEIVAEMGCSPSTVRYYKAQLSNKNTENGKDSGNASTTISNNNLDVDDDVDKDEDVDAEREKEREKEKENEREREKETLFSPTFAHEIYLLYQKAGLPLPKSGEADFLQYDMKKASENIQQQHLSQEDVIEAVKNYAKVMSLRDTWYHARLSFDKFTREDNILRFIPDRFDLKTYTNGQVILNDEYDGSPW